MNLYRQIVKKNINYLVKLLNIDIYFKRKIYNKLPEWKENSDGKTALLYEDYILIDLILHQMNLKIYLFTKKVILIQYYKKFKYIIKMF